MTTHEQTDRSNALSPAPLARNGNRLNDHLLPILAHELRQPLNAILFALEEAHYECNNESVAREARDLAKREALHMSRIIGDLMDVCRNAHGKLRLHLTRVDLAAIIHDAIASARPSLATRGHRLVVSIPPEPAYFVADASRLEQVLTNLLCNAAKYTDPAGRICLTAEASTDLVVIRVSDNGRGINANLLPRIFDTFQQGHDPKDIGLGGLGLGLGLSLVKSLVELHGGSVAAHSCGTGTGSEFVVRLPTCGPAAGACSTCSPRTKSPAI